MAQNEEKEKNRKPSAWELQKKKESRAGENGPWKSGKGRGELRMAI